MALTAATLGTELKDIPDFPADETATIDAWSDAWNVYWEESVAISAVTVDANTAPAAAVAAFKAAMVGIAGENTSTVAATLIKDACKAFWIAATPVLSYDTPLPPVPGPYLIVPPFFLNGAAEATFVAALVVVFNSNTSGSVGRNTSFDNLANAIHGAPQAGATFLDTTIPPSGGPLTYTVS